MAQFPGSIDKVTIEHIQALIDYAVPESLTLEFKSATYAQTRDDSFELLKDVSAFSNSSGGWLLIGVAESDGVAAALNPIVGESGDDHSRRLTQILQSSLDPRAPGIRMRALNAGDGHILVVRVPPSSIKPHRIIIGNKNRYYLRHSASAIEASHSELQSMFNQNSSAISFFDDYRHNRADEIFKRKRLPIKLIEARAYLVAHVAPVSALYKNAIVDLQSAEQAKHLLQPLSGYAGGVQYNFEGLLSYRGGEPGQTHGYVQLNRYGLIEAAVTGIRISYENNDWLSAKDVQNAIFGPIKMYLDLLNACEASPPTLIGVTIAGSFGARVHLNETRLARPESVARIPVEYLMLPNCYIEEYGDGEAYESAMKPALDALWNAGGRAKWTLLPD
ncbi:helix-turn-helix domain-containing protein [Novosphingobium colocasiae]|uniref:AlbA family DNA-binding domain-containing protein n=1 Tax=Novosphingobium colocasiae TaxID=1256513 RepID=UPI0035AF24E3